MTPLYFMWLASIAGAVLFFIAGFFLARRHLGEAAAVDEVVPPHPPPVVDTTASTAAAEPTDPEETVQALRAQVNELRNALRNARVREQGQAELERELLRLRGDRTELELQARQELVIELEAARRRFGELEQVCEENAVLRQQLAQAAADSEKLVQMEADLRELRARGLAASPRRRLPRLGTSPLRPAGDPRSTSEQLSDLLTRLRGKSLRAVALADEQGLPIVGLGDDTSSLAALAGYVTDIGRKMHHFVPMGSLRRMTVEDEHDATITACPLAAGDTHIALITLTIGPGPSARQMSDVLNSAASMIQ